MRSKAKASKKTKASAAARKARATKAAKAVPTIGIIHSGKFEGDPEMCFLAGLSYSGWEKNPKPGSPKKKVSIRIKGAGGQYGGSHGRDKIKNGVVGHGNVDLIVAAGGLVAAQGTKSGVTGRNIPFIYLIGRMPPGGISSPKCAGGVNLNTPSLNPTRVTKLHDDFAADVTSVYLVVNDNADMSGLERDDWRESQRNENFAIFFAGEDNDPGRFATYVAALGASHPTPTGVVVSADPFFRHARTQLTAALATLRNVPVCYPFQEFVDAAPAGSKKTCLHKPQLSVSDPASPDIVDTGYYQLGVKAGEVLNMRSATNPIPKVSSLTWDGNTNKWVENP